MSERETAPADDDTFHLLQLARQGDRHAVDRLFERHIPALSRWAHGRLPRWARDIADTSDLVQETVVATFHRLEAFEPRGDGALQAYLRHALINRVRNELRRSSRHPVATEIDSSMLDEGPSPLEEAIGVQTLERYDAALARLEPDERDAIVSRIEFSMAYSEIATALGKPSADAARMMVARALVRLAEEMNA